MGDLMYLVFKDINEWFKKEPNLRDKFKRTFDYVINCSRDFSTQINKNTLEKVHKSVSIQISDRLLTQALIDAFDDLLRLTNYHPTDEPNPIKEMSYIVYWLLRRKPIRLVSEDILGEDTLSDIFKARLLFINEEFCVKLLMNAVFEGKKEKSGFSEINDEARMQLKYYKRYLLYYLVYRIDSPKSLEAMALGCTVFPIWEVNPIIWEDAKNPIEDY